MGPAQISTVGVSRGLGRRARNSDAPLFEAPLISQVPQPRHRTRRGAYHVLESFGTFQKEMKP